MVEPSADTIEIREAAPADAAALGQLIETINGETEFLGMPGAKVPWVDNPEGRLRELNDKQSGVYLLAVHGGEFVGFLGAFDGVFASTRGIIFIAHVGIREMYRGRRIGTRLFQCIDTWARQRGARRLELRVAEANRRAQALYRASGFVVEGRIVDAAFRGSQFQSDYLMGRVIAPEPGPRWEAVEVPSAPTRRALPDLVIRPPVGEDAAILLAYERRLLAGSPIHQKSVSEISGLEDVARFLAEIGADADRFLRVAVCPDGGEQRIVGLVDSWIVKGYRSERDALFGLNVLPDFAGCGIGRSLVAALEGWARARGQRRLTTWIRQHNLRGARFAERLGFRQEVISPNHAVIGGRISTQVTLGKVLS
jgi:RimJ/RimL family protein N-acetyltransferase